MGVCVNGSGSTKNRTTFDTEHYSISPWSKSEAPLKSHKKAWIQKRQNNDKDPAGCVGNDTGQKGAEIYTAAFFALADDEMKNETFS